MRLTISTEQKKAGVVYLKDFKEFVGQVREEHYANAVDAIDQLGIQIPFPLTQENSNDLAGIITVMSTICAFELLEKYHNWLNSPE